ncbi:hypothetical protein ABH942_002407 [Flavobacterium sp. 28YEA47A]|uniref:hypothetical protein n=1 Tax=Flavobacterium sp. 28YEA47A TaxID=3156276 RepID=UPI0035144942
MRKIVIAIALFLVSSAGFAQEDAVSDVKIDMNFNKSLFPMAEGNMYMSTEPVAFIMANMMAQTYEEAKVEMQAISEDKDLTNVKKGELKEKGKDILYQTALVKNDDGQDLVMEIYVVKVDKQNTIMVSGGYDLKAKETFKDEIKKAALSAKAIK